jgi:cell division protease FtsH
MAATNRVDVLDPALLRPGRFDRRIMVNMPDADEREAILKIHAKNKPLAKDVSLREVALSTVGFTGADLANLLNEAALMTARHNKKEITMLEVTDAMFRVQMGPQKNSKKLSDKVKKLTAYHEAGHAVVLRATSEFEKVDRVTIIPAGQAGGYTAYKPIEDTDYYTEKMLLDTIKMSLGGRAAEEIFLGEVSTGAASDLRHCNDIAKNMIKRYGLSKKFRNMVFGDENEEVFLGYSMGQVQSYSEQTAAAIDAEIKAIIDDCYAETKRILIEKQAIVEGLAQRLIKKLTVDGPDFEKIYVNNGDLAAVFPDEARAEIAKSIDAEPAAATEEAAPAAPAAETKPEEETAPSWPAEAANLDHDSQNDPGPTD